MTELNPDSPIPLYHQLENVIKEKIDAKQFKPGEQIPSERDLSEKYDVSRMTIKKAIDKLVEQGILHRKRGKGTFISKEENRIDTLQELIGFNKRVKMLGDKPSSILLERKLIKSDDFISKKLNIAKESDIIFTRRIRLSNEIPKAYEESYIPKDICPKILEIDLERESIYNTFMETGNRPTKARQKIEAISVDEPIKEVLNMEIGTPILKIDRITFSGEKPIQFSINFDSGIQHSVVTNSN